MTIMYSFCFWYSVRLGSIIVALTCICIAALIACSFGMSDLERTSSNVEYWLQTSNVKMAKYFLEAMRDDPKNFLVAFITALSVYMGSCILLIYAAFQCNITYMYPFMILDFLRLVILSFALVVVLLLIKENNLNLGMIIGCSISGGFTLMYLWYQWFCTVSLWQIIREIEKLDHFLGKNKPNDFSMQGTPEENSYNHPFYLPNVTL